MALDEIWEIHQRHHSPSSSCWDMSVVMFFLLCFVFQFEPLSFHLQCRRFSSDWTKARAHWTNCRRRTQVRQKTDFCSSARTLTTSPGIFVTVYIFNLRFSCLQSTHFSCSQILKLQVTVQLLSVLTNISLLSCLWCSPTLQLLSALNFDTKTSDACHLSGDSVIMSPYQSVWTLVCVSGCHGNSLPLSSQFWQRSYRSCRQDWGRLRARWSSWGGRVQVIITVIRFNCLYQSLWADTDVKERVCDWCSVAPPVACSDDYRSMLKCRSASDDMMTGVKTFTQNFCLSQHFSLSPTHKVKDWSSSQLLTFFK